MNTRYVQHSNLDDAFGTGITVYAFPYGEFVKTEASPGYLEKEISKEEFDLWTARIATPDMVTYFPGIFPGVGVVDKATYEKIQAAKVLDQKAMRQVTRAQGLKALSRKGITREAIYAAIDALGGQAAEDAHIDFDEQTTWRRSSELVKTMGQSLGMTPDQLDDLFTLASTL